MQIRESRLLIAAVAFGMLAAVPLACGGKDDNNNNGGDSDTTDSDPNSVQTICADIKAKFDSCGSQLSCASTIDTANFVSTCVASTTPITPTERDSLVADTCADLDTNLCGPGDSPCPNGLSCGPVDSEVGGACVDSNGAPASTGASCTSGATCSNTEICLAISSGSAQGRCTATCCINELCAAIDNATPTPDLGCVDSSDATGFTPPSSADACATFNDCQGGYACAGASAGGATKDGKCIYICESASPSTSSVKLRHILK